MFATKKEKKKEDNIVKSRSNSVIMTVRQPLDPAVPDTVHL